MGKDVLIIENNLNALRINEEFNKAERRRYLLGGEFTRFNILNRNDRVYTAEGFLPALDAMKEEMQHFTIFGELDHPNDFTQSLSKTSHAIKSIDYNSDLNIVEGTIELLSTTYGKEARAIVDDGYNLFVSSRAAGITEANGTVTLKKLFTYDIVSNPGFATAKMNTINESLGYSSNKNYYMYEITNESDINTLFNHRGDDSVVKKDLEEYNKYLENQYKIQTMKLENMIKEGTEDRSTISALIERIESLQESKESMQKYLEYLSTKFEKYYTENTNLKNELSSLKEKTNTIIEGVNTTQDVVKELSSTLETTTNVLSENFNNAVAYMDQIASGVNESENTTSDKIEKVILFTEHQASNINLVVDAVNDLQDKHNRLEESHLDLIGYAEYISEEVKNDQEYTHYLVEQLDENITKTNNAIVYNDYLAETADKTLCYLNLIKETMNSKINESVESVVLPTLEDFGFSDNFDFDEEEFDIFADEDDTEEDEFDINNIEEIDVDSDEFDSTEDIIVNNDDDMFIGGSEEDEEVETDEDDGLVDSENTGDEIISDEEQIIGTLENKEEETLYIESESELSKQINILIEETKKRKKVEENNAHFLTFLNRSQVISFNELTNEEQETVKLYIGERQYFSQTDVLRLINEALAFNNETIEDKLQRHMPENIKTVWEQLSEKQQNSIFSQAKLWQGTLNTPADIEHFWETRNIKVNPTSKKMVSNTQIIAENKLSDNEITAIMERFKNISK